MHGNGGAGGEPTGGSDEAKPALSRPLGTRGVGLWVRSSLLPGFVQALR